jgi:hypothetical protein
MTRAPIHASKGAVGFRHRSALNLMTMSNGKTPKGESLGWLSAILYLMPHTSGGGQTLCPYSTEACRSMCLSGSGLSGLPRAMGAKQRRTDLLLKNRAEFMDLLRIDVAKLARVAQQEDLKPAVRLNGTSDLLWERVPYARGTNWSLMQMWPDLQFYDYTKIPLASRARLHNYHLTFSIEGPGDMARALGYLDAGHSVAAVVDETQKARLLDMHRAWSFIDGDETDLRFLDPPGSIVLLKPKGHVRTSLLRPDLLADLEGTVAEIAA